MRSLYRFSVLVMVMGLSVVVWAKSDDVEPSSATPAARYAGAVDRIFEQEAKLVDTMHSYTPLVETYIQRMKPDNDLGALPDKDRYFLGRLVLGEKGIANTPFKDQNKARFMTRVLDRLDSFYRINYAHLGFMQ